MNKSKLHRRNFLLHVKQWPGFEEPVLCKEPGSERPESAVLKHLHNEFAVTRHLDGVSGVRKALAMEGSESQPVLLLQYVQGCTLSELIRRETLGLDEKLRLAVNLARILDQVHDRQVMHRELNSSNILVADSDLPDSEGGVYVIDFGLATMTGTGDIPPLPPDEAQLDALAYISPEQTGRLNRQVDYRTDFYSLGVTLYELLTGRLPFEKAEVLELVHDQIARQSIPPNEIDKEIPGPLSDIVSRLLAKDADDRYQTAGGLRSDLEICLKQFQQSSRVEPFELGRNDFTGRLRFPRKPYGRQDETEQLKGVLDRALGGQPQLLMVAGYPGIGKTTLVRELQNDVLNFGGRFIEGKFDQLRRSRPFAAWDLALTRLVDEWLAQSEESLSRRRDALLGALGDLGQVLIDIIPAMERILGPQPDVPQLGGRENQRRLSHVFRRFINCLATPEHPLIIFLDDLQWIDQASLSLLESLFTDGVAGSLLVVGAYRDSEVGSTHPVSISLERMRTDTEQVNILPLKDLQANSMVEFLADTLEQSQTECRELAHAVIEKTGGNPFFFRQILLSFEADGQLKFDKGQRRWIWEESIDQLLQARGGVVDFMIGKIRAFSAETQGVLSMASCVGSRFELETLQIILGKPVGDILTALHPVIQGGLVVREREGFAFSHDRIQEAAYALVSRPERPRVHLDIGRALFAATGAEKLEEDIFTFIDHLNAGQSLIKGEVEKKELAGLNLKAALRARAFSDFEQATQFIKIGVGLLGQDPWKDSYDLVLSLLDENAELALITGKPDDVTIIAEEIHAHARNALDQVRAYTVQIEAENSRYRPAVALEIGAEVLEELGIRLPANPDASDVLQLNNKMLGRLANEGSESLASLPLMTDKRALAASTILTVISPAAYTVNPRLLPFINYEGVLLTLEFGRNTWSAFFFARAALVAIASVSDTMKEDELRDLLGFAKRMKAVSHDFFNYPESETSRTKVLHMLALIAHWSDPINRALELAWESYESIAKTGDQLAGAYGCLHIANNGLAAGLNLDTYRRQVSGLVKYCEHLKQQSSAQWISMFLQAAQRLEQTTPEPNRLIGEHFNEDEWLPEAEAANDLAGRHFLHVLKLQLTYYFELDEEIENFVQRAEAFLAGGLGMVSYANFYFYAALAKLRVAGQCEGKERSDAIRFVDDNLQLMKSWSESSPSNYRHKLDLVAAERARITGQLEDALSHYEQAIDRAQAGGFVHEEALANELYARFWATRGYDRFAGPLMREAHSLYLKWGATAKARHLSQRYPKLLTGRNILDDHLDRRAIPPGIPPELDILTVLKASRDIAGELDLDQLLSSVLSTVIESTGAQKGFLLFERQGRWTIEAEALVEDKSAKSRIGEDIENSGVLAEGIVRYVDRTRETVVLDDASRSGKFLNHQYLRNNRVRSLVCKPLIGRGKTSAILYLENNLAPGVFSTNRLTLLQLLSSQMSVSIENARIHAQLQRMLDAQSRALVSAEAQIKTLFETSPMGIALTTPEGEVLTFNSAFLKILGISSDAYPQIRVIDFYEDPGDRVALLNQVDELGYVQDYGIRMVRADGSHFDANLSMSKLVLEGNEVLLGMVQDVTDQIAAKQNSAVLEERARLARDLHDAVTQTILSASLLADTNVRNAEAGRETGTQDLKRLSGMMHGALDEMRTLLLDMRPDVARNRTLGQFLSAMVEAARVRTPAEVNLRVEGDRVLPENVTTQLQRVAQESLGNAIRHANAGTITIDLKAHPDRGVTMRISDDGCGFEETRKQEGHYGIGIMAERAAEIGAVLEIQSTVGKGTQVSVYWS